MTSVKKSHHSGGLLNYSNTCFLSLLTILGWVQIQAQKKKKKNSQEPKTLLEDLSQWREKEDMDSESLDLVLCFSVVTG